jgi:benzoate-CoA ligase
MGTASPPVDLTRYNAAVDLVESNLAAGRAEKLAYIDDHGHYTYADLNLAVRRASSALRAAGLQPEQRVLLCMHDCFALVATFLGAIRAGIVPVLANTLLTSDDYAYLLADSRAAVAIVSAPLAARLEPLQQQLASFRRLIIDDNESGEWARLCAAAAANEPAADTHADEACFWLYSSGSTGRPKGTVHVHSSLRATADLYAIPVLGIEESDLVFSAAKLFFAYGLGNALSFPLSVGATTLLMAERPTPDAVFKRLLEHGPTVFYGVPTLYAALLASPNLPTASQLRLRRCTSAGEPLPEDIGRRWHDQFGLDILDGIGSTEMLHIFLSNRPGDLRPNTTGKAVPGYDLRVVDDEGRPVPAGELGELQVRGPTAALMYWNNRARSRSTFLGEWTRTGDKYRLDPDGYYVFCGRSDDMLKVGGIWVSPTEVESTLISHPAVLEAAVVGCADAQGLTKPQAFVVLNSGHDASPQLAGELQAFVKSRLAPFKYPRWIEFVSDLPRTANGKIQRFKLRQHGDSGAA